MRLSVCALLASAMALAACGPAPQQNDTQVVQQPQPDPAQQMRDQARQEEGELRFVVDRSERSLRVFRGDELVRTHDVAVGDADHETPTGSWRLYRVDINPEWIPPDSEWAEDRERRAPGDPENPMGRARLVFDPPYTIHGTDQLDSLGQAASHGSIRVANEVVIELARMLLRAGGAWEGEEWFQQRIEGRDTMYQIELEHPVSIEVVE